MEINMSRYGEWGTFLDFSFARVKARLKISNSLQFSSFFSIWRKLKSTIQREERLHGACRRTTLCRTSLRTWSNTKCVHAIFGRIFLGRTLQLNFWLRCLLNCLNHDFAIVEYNVRVCVCVRVVSTKNNLYVHLCVYPRVVSTKYHSNVRLCIYARVVSTKSQACVRLCVYARVVLTTNHSYVRLCVYARVVSTKNHS